MKVTYESICEKLGFDPFVNPPKPVFNGHEDDSQEKEKRLQVVLEIVRNIPHPCSTLLEMQFFQKKKQSEIASAMGYESADSVKTMVSRCKGKVRTIVKQRYKELGL